MITDRQKSMMQLIRRSTPDAAGWYKVSEMVWPLLDQLPDELIERDPVHLVVRLTDKGNTVMDYLV